MPLATRVVFLTETTVKLQKRSVSDGNNCNIANGGINNRTVGELVY
jgi:hypothetical protein